MDAECPHLNRLPYLEPPKLSQQVHREECTQCFDNQDHPLGVECCLSCFNGGCLDPDRHHAATHAQKNSHAFSLNVRRRPKPSAGRKDAEEPPTKMTKLAIVADREEDAYEHTTELRCWACDPAHGRALPGHAPQKLVDGVLAALSAARQSEVQAWEEEITACEHTLALQQDAVGAIAPSGLAHCRACDLKENLWLCLTCGSLGCGRAQYGGAGGGNGHGLSHYDETKHPVSVKLGTITPEGGADIYCYQCNDARLDPELSFHLAAFGINVAAQKKTEKSMTELQIEHNLKYDFSLTGEDGAALEPLFGPGLTGLANLGNSCYMASVLQTLFALRPFQDAYLPTAPAHWAACTNALPATCVPCQMHKLADGLLSGRYSHPRPASSAAPAHPLEHAAPRDAPAFQDGVRPADFKALVGRGHAEFATMRQQDAEEFFGFLLEALRRDARAHGARPPAAHPPTAVFGFGLESRLQCGACGGVRYRVDAADALSVAVPAHDAGVDADGKTQYAEVALADALGGVFGAEALEYTCPRCAKTVVATKQTRLASFPAVLVVHAKKFTLVNWVPAKLDIPLRLPADDVLVLDGFLGRGLQPGEDALPDDAAVPAATGGGAPAAPPLDEAALAQLEGMGFPRVRCEKALRAAPGGGAEAAMEWLFAHMDDPGIDDPIVEAAGAGAGAAPTPAPAQAEPAAEQVAMLADMGFTPAQASKALRGTGGNAERAVEWLFSHPDDDGADAPAPAPAGGAGAGAGAADVPGDTALPARYRLKAFVSHKGPSVHSGHYVAHIRARAGADADANAGWVLFNDEKVVAADAESVRALRKLAYMYVFERV